METGTKLGTRVISADGAWSGAIYLAGLVCPKRLLIACDCCDLLLCMSHRIISMVFGFIMPTNLQLTCVSPTNPSLIFPLPSLSTSSNELLKALPN